MSRYFNTVLAASSFAFLTLLVWSGLFLLSRLAINGVLLSEVAILAPVILLALLALYYYSKPS